MGVLKAFISTLKAVFAYKEFSRKLLAYGYAVCGMCSAGGDRTDEPPCIYELDEVTDRMNGDIGFLNENFGLKVKEWRRDEVRVLMDAFGDIHGQLSDVNGRRLTVQETSEKILAFMNQPFWRIFRLNLELGRKGRT